MLDYDIWSGRKPNTDLEFLAISPDELNDPDISGPEDFFVPGTTEIEKLGQIQVTGDIHLLDGTFSVKS